MNVCKLSLLSVIMLICAACADEAPQRQSFYHWKTVYRPSTDECDAIKRCERLYLRFFDVTAGDEAYHPAGTLIMRDSIPDGVAVVPVVFIVNDVLRGMTDDSIPVLAGRLCRRIMQIGEKAGISDIPEWQLDCDWTESTRERYFHLLRCVKAHPAMAGRQLSVTLRLHQWKYRKKAGIPPVDKVCLMCYNMGRLTEAGSRNSIMNTVDLEAYLAQSSPYPLPTDVAFPLFSWGVCFRNDKYCGLINGLQTNDLHSAAFVPLGDNHFRIDSTCRLRGTVVHKNDIVRLETVDAALLKSAGRIVARYVKYPDYLVWFPIDSLYLQKISTNEKNKIANLFR